MKDETDPIRSSKVRMPIILHPSSFILIFLILHPSSLILASSPNVILIVTDDQGYGDMACHGNPWLKTPNLDRMHAESVRLEDYHVDPVCTPTRAALMTGRYSTRVGAWAVTEGRQLLNADEVTMAEIFLSNCYNTGMFGKWHLGDPYPYGPRFRGFENVVCHKAGGVDEIGNPDGNDFFDDTYFRNGKPEHFKGYCTDVFFSEAIEFIHENKKKSSNPFFIYLPLNAMHGPFTVAEKYSKRFTDTGHPELRAKFYGMIENFDENLGRLFATLKKTETEKNTIVIFMGDNGTAQGISGGRKPTGFNAGMRGKKGSCYEGGHRVAGFVRWPGELKAGVEVHQLTSNHDWLPTLIDLCELAYPKLKPLDGRSFAPLLRGEKVDWPDRTIFVQRQADQFEKGKVTPKTRGKGFNKYPTYAVLTEKWRFVDGELYDIVSDPDQKKNVAKQHPNVVTDLYARYSKHFDDVSSHKCAWTPFHVGANEENPTQFNVRDWHPTEGGVIWKKEHLSDDAKVINGFWAVNVKQAGDYRIRLARHPDDRPAPMNAVSARIRIGDIDKSQKVESTAKDVTFNLKLNYGIVKLQTWLTDTAGKVRGAYYIYFEKL